MSHLLGALERHVAKVTEANRTSERVPHSGALCEFCCIAEPSIGIAHYMTQIRPLLQPDEWIVAVILVNRLEAKGNVSIDPLTIHRLIIAAAITSMKLLREFCRHAVEFFGIHT
eukprot:Hpha_TRINITY_DN26469_c0_g1::TRINITY_DN26469_c0_g1_i1::g.33933::m.33933